MDPSQNWKELYVGWLRELCESVRGRSQYQERAYERAAAAIAAADISTQTPSQLKKLPGVGDKTIKVLTQRALGHCKSLKLSTEWDPGQANPTPHAESQEVRAGSNSTVSKRTYVPRYGTTPYHVLVGLRKLEKMDPGMGFGKDAILRHIKNRLVENKGGQHRKLVPSLTPAYTRLISNGYITSRSRQYFLEPEGRDLANRFLEVERQARVERGSDISSAALSERTPQRPSSREFAAPTDYDSSIWEPGQYTIKLLLDNREVSAAENRNGFGDALSALGIDLVVLPLPVGDCCWVAEHTLTRRRAIIDTIIERKRLDDLVASIIDGRFQEQKHRLEKSCVPRVVYLIENGGADREFLDRHQKRINTALSQIVAYSPDSFQLEETESQAETVFYFKHTTEAITDTFAGCSIKVIHPNISAYQKSMSSAISECEGYKPAIDYDSFVEATQKSRNKTVAHIFIHMLMTTSGISAEKAIVIQSLFNTPRELVNAYARLPPYERPNMLKDLTADNPLRRRINSDLSRKLSRVWGGPHGDGDTDPDDPDLADTQAAPAAPKTTAPKPSAPARRHKSAPIPVSPLQGQVSSRKFVLASSSPIELPAKQPHSQDVVRPTILSRGDPFLVPKDPETRLPDTDPPLDDIIDLS